MTILSATRHDTRRWAIAISFILVPLRLECQNNPLPIKPASVKHVTVFKEPGKYAGWPANHGIWSWGNEILVGFEVGSFKYAPKNHSIDRDQIRDSVLARSTDGGETWHVESPKSLLPPKGVGAPGQILRTGDRPAVSCPGGIDFQQPGFALTARSADSNLGPSWFLYSGNRGKTWTGPFDLPSFGHPAVAARTDYLVDGHHSMTMFLTVARSDKREGRVIVVRTSDGGKTWNFVSYIGPEPQGEDYAIMPSSVRISDRVILTAIRHHHYIELWRSGDNAATWEPAGTPVPDTGRGNPPSMIKLADGRLALTWAHRASPLGIYAKISNDQGKTWGPDLVLRDDAGSWDLGYTRTVQRTDGKLVTVYYYNLDDRAERFIGATIWEPR